MGSLHGAMQRAVLAIVWSGATAAVLLKFAWVKAPKWLAAVIGIALGWVGVVEYPESPSLAARADVGITRAAHTNSASGSAVSAASGTP